MSSAAPGAGISITAGASVEGEHDMVLSTDLLDVSSSQSARTKGVVPVHPELYTCYAESIDSRVVQMCTVIDLRLCVQSWHQPSGIRTAADGTLRTRVECSSRTYRTPMRYITGGHHRKAWDLGRERMRNPLLTHVSDVDVALSSQQSLSPMTSL